MPGKGDAAPRDEPARRDAAYRRPPEEEVRVAIGRLLEARKGRYASQNEFRRALLRLLKRSDPKFALGGRRMRGLLVGTPGVQISVTFSERETRRPVLSCPVCSAPVSPIRNRTLFDDRVTLGYRCARCGYWTHLKRRVPVRYTIRLSSSRTALPILMRGAEESPTPAASERAESVEGRHAPP